MRPVFWVSHILTLYVACVTQCVLCQSHYVFLMFQHVQLCAQMFVLTVDDPQLEAECKSAALYLVSIESLLFC